MSLHEALKRPLLCIRASVPVNIAAGNVATQFEPNWWCCSIYSRFQEAVQDRITVNVAKDQRARCTRSKCSECGHVDACCSVLSAAVDSLTLTYCNTREKFCRNVQTLALGSRFGRDHVRYSNLRPGRNDSTGASNGVAPELLRWRAHTCSLGLKDQTAWKCVSI